MKKILTGIVIILCCMTSAMSAGCNSTNTGNTEDAEATAVTAFAGLQDLANDSDVIVMFRDGTLVKELLKGEEIDLYLAVTEHKLTLNEEEDSIVFYKKTKNRKYPINDRPEKGIFNARPTNLNIFVNQEGETFNLSELLSILKIKEDSIYNPLSETKSSFPELSSHMDSSDIVMYYDGFMEGYKAVKGEIGEDFLESSFFYDHITLAAKDSTIIFFIKKNGKKYEYTGGEKKGRFDVKKGLIYKNKKGDLLNIRDLLR